MFDIHSEMKTYLRQEGTKEPESVPELGGGVEDKNMSVQDESLYKDQISQIR